MNPINRCTIRTSGGNVWPLMVPVERSEEDIPADECVVHGTKAWRRKLLDDVAYAYGRLHCRADALVLAEKCLIPPTDGRRELLVDVLMGSFVTLLDELGWQKEIIRGDTLQRRRYANPDEFLMNLALEGEIDSLLVGHRQKQNLNQQMFSANDINLVPQYWKRPSSVGMNDCFLDSIARVGMGRTRQLL
jgi:hypothetical protein